MENILLQPHKVIGLKMVKLTLSFENVHLTVSSAEFIS